MEIRTVRLSDKKYPRLLKEIYDPPGELFYEGVLPCHSHDHHVIPAKAGIYLEMDLCLRRDDHLRGDDKKTDDRPLIAVVGSRKMSQRGKKYVKEIVPKLISDGFGIVSGLAYGVDAWAHEICLRSGGYALAVLPTPLDKIYPRENQVLAKKIVGSGGCLVTEFENGREIVRSDFLRRNRIVSGLCVGVLVVEADLRSGSIATANFALEQNREVWVCPASSGEPNSEGILRLIEDGATPFVIPA